ncbi:hypothetical protein J4461_02450 [Candidatus Pacearchaeota archaeon]|nr:hypothetical protein [Candidatus Pacearchaeota archaeon]
MNLSETVHLLAAVIILSVIAGFDSILNQSWINLAQAFLFSLILIFVVVYARKLMAYGLDCGVEHRLWGISRWGFAAHRYLKTDFPAGVALPLFLSVISLGRIKFPSLITYEATALKTRSAKRFGYYSYTMLTDWHNSIIGAAGIIGALLVSLVIYFLPIGWEPLSKIAAYYAFVNLIPYSKLDGMQIFMGSRVLWTTLALITAIFTSYAIFL